jgi:TonB-linked SusC/RagA family outer membrane protein
MRMKNLYSVVVNRLKSRISLLLLIMSALLLAPGITEADFLAVKGPDFRSKRNISAGNSGHSARSVRENARYELKGTITDESETPLPGVTIRIKNTEIGVITNESGTYSITIPNGATEVLQVSFLGFVTQEIPVKERSIINVVLAVDLQGKALNEVVVVGYQQVKAKYITGSVSSVSVEELSAVPTTRLSNAIAGRFPGVYISQATGAPGVGSSIRIGAANSWNASPPIYVIDGVVMNKQAFDQLSMNEVADISVLKDAAAASIYGARSTNGVILVTTKNGSAGKPTVQINSSYSFEKPTFDDDVLSDYDSHILNNVYWKKQTGTNWFGEDEIEMFEKLGYSTNYLEYLYRNPSTMTTSLSASGGKENIQFFLGGSFDKNTGFLDNMDFSKYNLRAKVTASLTKNLEIGLNISTDNGHRHQFNSSSPDVSDWYGRLKYLFYYIPIKIDNNFVSTRWLHNLPGLVNGNGGYVSDKNENVNALLHMKYDVPFIKGLSVIGKFSRNSANNFIKGYFIKQEEYDYGRTGSTGKVVTTELLGKVKSGWPSREYLSNTLTKTSSYQFNGQLSFVRDFGDHSIDAVAIYEQYDMGTNNFALTRYDFPLVIKDQFFATSDNAINSVGSGYENYVGRQSYVGSAQYRFKERYLLSASLRGDGSMLFAPGKRWGYFPSVSAGWILSEESFFKQALPSLRYFKVRGSLGYTGNDAIGGFQWQEAYYGGGQYFLGGANQNVIRYGGIINKNLTWEKSRSFNYGVDLLTTSNIGLQMNYWTRHTYDILGSRIITLPTTFGGTLPAENYGKVDSQGFEVALTYGNKVGDFKYDIRGNFSFVTNKIVKADFAANGLEVDNPNGKTGGYIATYKATGIIRTQQELDALPAGYTILGRKPVLGSLNYEDISGLDGKPDGVIDTYDRQVISKYGMGDIPYSSGLNFDLSWKGFSASIFFQSLFGHKKLYTDNWGRGFPLDARLYAYWGDAWSPENPDGKYPTIPGPSDPNSTMASSFWYENGGFVRLKNVSIGYDLPQTLLKHVGIKKVRLYVNGTNLFYLSGFKWYDPEMPSLASYPNMKQYSGGISITL